MSKPFPAREPLYLEDLVVGQRFETDAITLEPEEAHRFARAYDPQPFHLDDAAATASIFNGPAVSGWLTAALSMRLFVEQGPPIAGGLIGLGGEISWPLPTRPHDRLRLTFEVLEITPSRSKPDRGIVTFRNETRNQRDEVVQRFVGKMLVWKRPGAAQAARPGA